jgi:hypothetical protein
LPFSAWREEYLPALQNSTGVALLATEPWYRSFSIPGGYLSGVVIAEFREHVDDQVRPAGRLCGRSKSSLSEFPRQLILGASPKDLATDVSVGRGVSDDFGLRDRLATVEQFVHAERTSPRKVPLARASNYLL